MPSPLSLDEIVSRLESQIAFHREREDFHAAQEAAHREERARHAAELETLTRSLESLKAVGATAASLASRSLPSAPAPPPPDPDAGRRLSLMRMVTRVVEALGPEQVFGPKAVTEELNRCYQDRLRRPVPERLVSVNLRRLLDAGQLRSVRKGRPHHEALFARA
ncbi:MAG: hypothetical protein ACJ76N_00640 [Thermoanaerobaculia bacterium]